MRRLRRLRGRWRRRLARALPWIGFALILLVLAYLVDALLDPLARYSPRDYEPKDLERQQRLEQPAR